MNTPRLYVGTAGWHYDHWVGPFYPGGMPADQFLPYYAQRFRSVEINNTFYHLPKPEILAQWRDTVPRDFIFACKASRYITHMKKLGDPARSVSRFFETVGALERTLGPILFQLPPRWGANPDRLAAFLDALPEEHRYTFEFRDESWWVPEITHLLSDHGAAFCVYDLAGRRSPVQVTADFIYIRLHGPGNAYQGSYDGRTLRGWARRCRRWLEEGRDVFCYFDNDEAGYAAADARRLQEMLS